ncbi:hypothetical protein HN903_01120 [archaeon]|jgi:hypothetical protein|nr:hypothetical protein [archaeon]MBT7128333.1 hypothetical protein [archaeon]
MEDVTFNFVGKESVGIAKELGIIKSEGVMDVDGVPVALVLMWGYMSIKSIFCIIVIYLSQWKSWLFMVKKFGSLLGLMQRHYGNDGIVEENGQFHFASDEAKNGLIVPEHYNCVSCGVVEGEPERGGSNFAGVEPYRDCVVCGEELKR